MVQSPTDAEGQVGLIEVKVERPYGAYAQSYAEAVALARSDVDSYVTAFDGAAPVATGRCALPNDRFC